MIPIRFLSEKNSQIRQSYRRTTLPAGDWYRQSKRISYIQGIFGLDDSYGDKEKFIMETANKYDV